MSTSIEPNMNGINGTDDPFAAETPPPLPPHRFSSFDTQLFALNHPSSSPAQAKKALEVHLAETDRRIQETSNLGTTLVQQRVNLSNRLRDVSAQEQDATIGPDLRQKLVDIEREYNEVGRYSAKAFLGPKSDNPGPGDVSNAHFALNGKNPTSPTKFSSQATDSPSKVNVPRKHRNQASNNDHIEFAAEITTSLLGQVRHLQAVLVERDEAMKAANSDKSRLEVEAEGFNQRLRHLDDSEQRYKDENWNLETQLQDTNAAAREAASRETKLHQTLAAASSEMDATQRELDELKLNHGKTLEDHALERKGLDSELAVFRKNTSLSESEKSAMQRKIEELTSQNQELAKGIANRFKDEEAAPENDLSALVEDHAFDLSERDHSLPPSPTKGGQRHSMLESETLKSSLHHAHKMIQNLKGGMHREKSEKQDLKRMLQEARDELEGRRAEPNEKRLRSKSQQELRKPGRPMLGASRNSRTDVMMHDPEHDPEWEEQDEDRPRRNDGARSRGHVNAPGAPHLNDASDAYQTANETEDAFETANERDTTDNDAFQTGAESMAGDTSEELTETEADVTRAGTLRAKRSQSSAATKSSNRRSFQSTASTSDDEEPIALHTPLQGQPQRFKLKINRNPRRSRIGSSETTASSVPSTVKNSPASFIHTPQEENQSLAAELENISGDDGDGTPSKGSISSPRSTTSLKRTISDKRSSSSMRRSISSQPSTPGARPSTMVYTEAAPPVPRIPTVDSGMMTEPWTPSMNDHDDDSPSVTNSSTLPLNTASAITSRIFGSSPFSTPQNRGLESQSASGSKLGSASTSTSTPPRPVWDQPLQFSGMIPGIDQSSESTPLSTRSATSHAQRMSQRRSSDDQGLIVHSDDLARPEAEPRKAQSPPFSLSPIHSVESVPVQPTDTSRASESSAVNDSSHHTAEAGTGSILGSVFGWNNSKSAVPAPQILEDDTSHGATQVHPVADSESKAPLQELPANMVLRRMQDRDGPHAGKMLNAVYKADQGSQTLLSSEQIDNMLESRTQPPLVIPQIPAAAASMKPLKDIGAVSTPLVSRGYQDSDPTKGKVPESSRDSLGKSVKRPISATSIRSRIAQYPPLPPDHQEAIAAAAQRAPSAEPTNMGPPSIPASAYPRPTRSRTGSRPQTPSQQGLPITSSKGGTTPRAGRYSTVRSQFSRRSSVSSFASELDERFNIRADGMPMPQGFQANTDPRMIQAITQTMIGEMMWKYTRKAGRGEMSNTRHRRFFWVHPYTRTLYWSDRDPATADRAELKSKSVAIEAVRVVTDDNPMPPGLHRKSLIIVTPGRSVKFTAQTSQRHETWFNALSYLLLRTGPDGSASNNAGDLTDADVHEFNPQYGRTSRSRISLASFKSSKSQNRKIHSSLSRAPTGPDDSSQTQLPHPRDEASEDDGTPVSLRRRISRSLSRSRGSKVVSNRDSREPMSDTGTTPHASIASRISGMWKQPPSIRESMRSRTSMRADVNGQPEGSNGRTSVNPAAVDSAEDLRRVIEEREGKGDLENVRACCDGRHDVGSLTKNSRHHSHAGSKHRHPTG